MKVLNGNDLAGFIKERQIKQVRNLRQEHAIFPKLAIVYMIDDPMIVTYMTLKKSYGRDILIEVDIHKVDESSIATKIKSLNDDETVHGIIVQLPLKESVAVDTILSSVQPEKDVDGLGDSSLFDPATPTAINWLLAGYNIELKHKRIVVVGHGRLVGEPLVAMWKKSGYSVEIIKREDDLSVKLHDAEVIVSATGHSGLLVSKDVPIGAVVVDAGTASESGKQHGDVADEVYSRDDLTITPQKGGVGPLTVTALFDNVIKAGYQKAKSK